MILLIGTTAFYCPSSFAVDNNAVCHWVSWRTKGMLMFAPLLRSFVMHIWVYIVILLTIAFAFYSPTSLHLVDNVVCHRVSERSKAVLIFVLLLRSFVMCIGGVFCSSTYISECFAIYITGTLVIHVVAVVSYFWLTVSLLFCQEAFMYVCALIRLFVIESVSVYDYVSITCR